MNEQRLADSIFHQQWKTANVWLMIHPFNFPMWQIN